MSQGLGVEYSSLNPKKLKRLCELIYTVKSWSRKRDCGEVILQADRKRLWEFTERKEQDFLARSAPLCILHPSSLSKVTTEASDSLSNYSGHQDLTRRTCMWDTELIQSTCSFQIYSSRKLSLLPPFHQSCSLGISDSLVPNTSPIGSIIYYHSIIISRHSPLRACLYKSRKQTSIFPHKGIF